MILGVTGTREGLTDRQALAVKSFLVGMYVSGLQTVHHGCCIGADAFIHKLCVDGPMEIGVIIHPPINTKNMASLSGESFRHEPKEYMERNRDIVDDSDVLLVMPKTKHEQVRSGTWACYRYAGKVLKPMVIIRPDGSVEGVGLL